MELLGVQRDNEQVSTTSTSDVGPLGLTFLCVDVSWKTDELLL